MKKMKKSALAAAVLLSLSMMGSAYAEENYTDPIIVNAGETFTIGQDYNNVKIAVNDVDGVLFNSVLVDGVGYVPVDKDGNQVEGAKSTLFINPTGDILISAGGNPISRDATTGIWTWDGTGTENVYGIKAGTTTTTGSTYLGSPNVILKAKNITLRSGLNYEARGIGFFPSTVEYADNSSLVIDATDTVYLEGQRTGLYLHGAKGTIDGRDIYFTGVGDGGSALQIRNNARLDVGQNRLSEQVTMIGFTTVTLQATAESVVNIDAESINIIGSGSDKNKKGIQAQTGALVNITQQGSDGDGINIATTHYGVVATDLNTVVNLKGNKVNLVKNGTTAAKHGGVNVTTGAKVVFMADTERQSAISVGGQIDVTDADSTLVFDLANGVAGDSVTIKGVVNNAGIINLDFDDNAKDNMTTTSTWNGTGTTNINFDIDLANTANSDAITIGGKVTDQTFKLGRINILADGNATSYQLITRKSGAIEFNTVKVIKDDTTYTFSDSGKKDGSINIAKVTGTVKLSDIIKDKDVNNYSFTEKDITVDADLGALVGEGRELTIDGNGNEIDGNGKKGVTVDDGQILNLINLTMNGFSGNAVTNNGTVNTQGDFYADKVENNGTMNTSGFAYIDELAMGDGATVKVDGQLFSDTVTAIGSNNTMGAEHTYAFGENNEVTGRQSIAAGFGNKVSGSNSGAFGDPNEVSGDGSYAVGNNNTVSGNNSFALGNSTNVSGNGSVALGNGSIATEDNVVSVGSETQQRKIVNVADGEVAENSKEAVNGGQLWKVEQEIEGAIGADVTELENKVDSNVSALNNRIDHMGTRINKVGAGAAALAAMHPVYDEDSKLTFSAGLGAYRNEKAAAVGMFFRFSPRVMMNAGATVGNDNNMYNVGLNFALDKHVRGGLPSKAVMAKQLTAQNEKIEVLTAENQGMKKEIAELKAMVQALIANK